MVKVLLTTDLFGQYTTR